MCLYSAVCGRSRERAGLVIVGGTPKEVGQGSWKPKESDLGKEGVSKEQCRLPGGCANHPGLFIYIYF